MCRFLAFGAAADEAAAFKAANQLYDTGQIEQAIAAYEKIEPKSAHLYFNLGNAWFRQNQFGRAILNYERARQLSPRDPDILANLKFAQQRAGVEETNTQPVAWKQVLQEFAQSRTLNQWTTYQLASLWLTILSVAIWIWFPKSRSVSLTVAICTGTIFFLTAGFLGYRVHTERSQPAAVVIVPKTEARFAPLQDATVHIQLTEGTLVRIREDRDQWLHVERADGQQGWVKADSIARI
jgi:tetratricopeptide (TPR) repeat protein